MNQKFGELDVCPASQRLDLLATATSDFIRTSSHGIEFGVTEIDPSFSDTTAFCDHYKLSLNQAANCVIIKASRNEKVWFAACVILGTTKADVNGLARRHLNARKASFAPMEETVTLTKMEYGGITPIGLPADWPILIDRRVADAERVIVGSGIRKSKVVVSGKALANLPGAVVLENLGIIK